MKLYAITVQSEIYEGQKDIKKHLDDTRENIFIDPDTRKEMIIRKLDKLVKRQTEALNKVSIKDQNPNEVIKNYTEKSLECNSHLESVLSDLHNSSKKNKVSLDKAKKIFSEVNEKEKNMNSDMEEINNHKLRFMINKNIDNIFKKFEALIDEVSDEKNYNKDGSLNLDKKFLMEKNYNFLVENPNFHGKENDLITSVNNRSKVNGKYAKKNKNILIMDDAKSRKSNLNYMDDISNKNNTSIMNIKNSYKSSKRINIEAIDKTYNDI